MEAHKSSVRQVHSVAIATMHPDESLLSRPPGSVTIRTSQEGLDVLQSSWGSLFDIAMSTTRKRHH